jgi:hypothetical protein
LGTFRPRSVVVVEEREREPIHVGSLSLHWAVKVRVRLTFETKTAW